MIIKYLIEVILLSEFLAAIVGGIFTLAGTFIALWFQFRKDDKDKRKDYHNDQVSSLDVTAYKAAKVRNNYLNFETSNFNKENTMEIYQDIETDFKSLDTHVQNLISLMSHHSDQSNTIIQKLLGSYEPVENQYNKLKVAYKIYHHQYNTPDFDKNGITFSKRKLDIEIDQFIDKLEAFAKTEYANHQLYKPTLNPTVDKSDAIYRNKKY